MDAQNPTLVLSKSSDCSSTKPFLLPRNAFKKKKKKSACFPFSSALTKREREKKRKNRNFEIDKTALDLMRVS